MRKVLIVICLFSCLNYLQSQCSFSSGTITQTNLNSCLGSCDPCTIQISGNVETGGDIDLSTYENLTIEVTGTGSLVFEKTMSNTHQITLSESSQITIAEGGSISTSSNPGDVRLDIGGATYTGNNFAAIIAAGGANSSGVLPVELTHFAARTKDDMVELDWTTATELNNDFFQIEHSRDGIQFQPVGKVKGEGTTTEIINYNFMHRQPVGGTNYYRLKQVDYDGAFEYSDIVVAEVNSRTGGVQIYPNPTIDKAVIQMNERPERVTFTLTTLLGQRLDLQPGQSDAGWELDLSSLPKGVYILQMEYDGQHLSRKIVRE